MTPEMLTWKCPEIKSVYKHMLQIKTSIKRGILKYNLYTRMYPKIKSVYKEVPQNKICIKDVP